MDKDMRGDLAPFELGLITIQTARVFTLECQDGPVVFNMNLTAYFSGKVEIKARWHGEIPDHILLDAPHLLDDDEKNLRQMTAHIPFERVPRIVERYAMSDESIHWTIVLGHMKHWADQAFVEAKASYERAIVSLETAMILEDSNKTEQAEFAEDLRNDR